MCVYCKRTFVSRELAERDHPVCNMWSCSFLPGSQHVIYTGPASPATDILCCFCNDQLVGQHGKIRRRVVIDHMLQHNFRKCSQKLYFSGQQFRQHLQDEHRMTFDATLFAGWTLLLKYSQHSKPSVFHQQVPSPVIHRTQISLDQTKRMPGDMSEHRHRQANFMGLTESSHRRELAKL